MTLTLTQPVGPEQPNLGSAMSALLAQVPPTLAEQIRDAWSNDLQFMFSTGMDAGSNNVWSALKRHGYNVPDLNAPARPQLRVIEGGAL